MAAAFRNLRRSPTSQKPRTDLAARAPWVYAEDTVRRNIVVVAESVMKPTTPMMRNANPRTDQSRAGEMIRPCRPSAMYVIGLYTAMFLTLSVKSAFGMTAVERNRSGNVVRSEIIRVDSEFFVAKAMN